MDTSMLLRQKFTNVQTVQAGVTKVFEEARVAGSFVQVLRNGNEPLGVLIPQDVWEDWLEDMDASHSDAYKKRVDDSRKDSTRYSSADVKKRLKL